jgi:hypothetical protein
MVGLQSCRDFKATSILDCMVVIKKLNRCSRKIWSNKGAHDLPFGWMISR